MRSRRVPNARVIPSKSRLTKHQPKPRCGPEMLITSKISLLRINLESLWSRVNAVPTMLENYPRRYILQKPIVYPHTSICISTRFLPYLFV